MNKRRIGSWSPACWLVAMALWVMPAPAPAAQEPVEPAPEPGSQVSGGNEARPAAPAARVTGAGPIRGNEVDLAGKIDVGEPVAVVVEGLDGWIGAGDDLWPDVRLFVNGREIETLGPGPPRRDIKALVFNLERFDRHDSESWSRLMQLRDGIEARANISVGTAGGKALATTVEARPMVLVNARQGWLAAVFSLLVIVVLIWLAIKRGLLSDSGPPPTTGKKPYSLARAQTAWWFILILCSYLFLSLMSGSTVDFPNSVLGLMGISAVTFVGAEIVSTNKQRPVASPASKGFIQDVLATGGEISFHRFQMAVWTLVLGAIFVIRVSANLAMPDFDATLLGLMGLSNGTFLGMKIPEGDKGQ